MGVLVEFGANIQKRTDSSSAPFFMASWMNFANAMKWLPDHNIDIDAATDWGFTTLLVASRNGNVELMKILLDAHAKIEY